MLANFRHADVQSLLAITGDKPVSAKGVFELESIGLIDMISNINNAQYLAANPKNLEKVHQFYTAAAVSPFKYTEPSLVQQYYKMEKKITAGANFLITQVGWDWKKSKELFDYMTKNDINVPVLGNVYLLSTISPAPRLMHDIKLPGCYVSDELLEKIYSESVDEHINRAAQQVAMYKSLGAAGVDIGGVHDFDMFKKILKIAAQIGDNWQEYKNNLCWPPKKAYYLYAEGKQKTAAKTKKTCSQRMFNAMHRAILNPKYRGFSCFKKTMAALGIDKGKGVAYKAFNSFEKVNKYLLFDCQECGDCYLPENFSLCTLGQCEKGLDNAPCGDATVDGFCGNDLERVCVGEKIYNAASAQKAGLQKLRNTINKPRNPALAHQSSMINYLFARDHTMKNPIIYIGESVHASIPKTGVVMKQLADLGPDAYTKDSPQLQYIIALIQSQASDGADYIAVNLDAFGENDPQTCVDMMKIYVRLVREFGKGVPICIDSSDDNVLKTGLEEWYKTDKPVAEPLVNSIKTHTMDTMFPLKNIYPYSFIGLLVSEEKATGPGGSHSVDELYNLAKSIFDPAVDKWDFKPEQIFFDSTVFPLAIDMPMEPGVPGYTYRAFETIKKIKTDPRMKNVHCSLGVSNCVRDLPARKVGVCRAYVAKAMEYGLDAGIVNTANQFGKKPVDPKLLKIVDAFAKMDGSAERLTDAMTLMGQFCANNRKPAK
jgi:methylenetetrahydrofolate reductase (NADPH)